MSTVDVFERNPRIDEIAIVSNPMLISDFENIVLQYSSISLICLQHSSLPVWRYSRLPCSASQEANLVLIEGIRGGNTQIRVEAPLVLFDEDGQESKQIKMIHGRL